MSLMRAPAAVRAKPAEKTEPKRRNSALKRRDSRSEDLQSILVHRRPPEEFSIAVPQGSAPKNA